MPLNNKKVKLSKKQLQRLAEAINVKINSNPIFAKNNISDCYKLGNLLIKNSTINNSPELTKYTNRELLHQLNKFRNAYLNFLPYLVYPHAIERHFMETISMALKDRLMNLNSGSNFAYLYEILTSPTIHEIDEQIDFLLVAKKIKQMGWNQDVQRSLSLVKNKYIWQPFWTVTAKPLTSGYFKDAVQAYADSNVNLDDEILNIKQGQIDRKNKLEKTLKEIKAPKLLRAYVELLQGYMYLRTYRKNIISKAHYLHLPLLLEIGERMGIGEDIKLISYEEMINYLQGENLVAQTVIKKRKEAWAVLSICGKTSIVCGKKQVNTVAKRYKIEDVQKQVSQKIVKGRPACLGKIIGKVRVIKNNREFNKVQQNDVLVTPMTTPDFVPILGRVSAIITDEGGVTCHAAIVSREFNIPCIVGTGNATKVFKDGDLIEVDANLGMAKII